MTSPALCQCLQCTRKRDEAAIPNKDHPLEFSIEFIRAPEEFSRMILCPICGNKRCPHANDHRNQCTGSNEPGQPGSDY